MLPFHHAFHFPLLVRMPPMWLPPQPRAAWSQFSFVADVDTYSLEGQWDRIVSSAGEPGRLEVSHMRWLVLQRATTPKGDAASPTLVLFFFNLCECVSLTRRCAQDVHNQKRLRFAGDFGGLGNVRSQKHLRLEGDVGEPEGDLECSLESVEKEEEKEGGGEGERCFCLGQQHDNM